MPSPFPGMDPYLEHPDNFPSFHSNLITYAQEYLQPRLPEPYFAKTVERVWVEMTERYVEPDVDVMRHLDRGAPSRGAGGGVAVAEPRSRPVLVRVPHDEHREPFLEIHTRRRSEKRLITSIEILSLANKTRTKGRELYLAKQREVLDSEVHLVEIDLLRSGQHTTAVPLDRARAKAGLFDYHVCVHRFDRFEDYFVYPIRLAERLPEIAVPLLPADGTVALDLQAVMDRAYDAGPYRREIDYEHDRVQPPLKGAMSRWARKVLRAAGHLG